MKDKKDIFPKPMTLCFPIKQKDGQNQLLLGFNRDTHIINGFGGKVEEGETKEQATIRELQEEINITVKEDDLDHKGTVSFIFPDNPEIDSYVEVFTLTQWEGQPEQTSETEMSPFWCNFLELPWTEMQSTDSLWLFALIQGYKFKACLIFNEDNTTIHYSRIEINPDELDNAWDRQLNTDARIGRLDHLAEEALQDVKDGKYTLL